MAALLLSPHNDDETLFAFYTLLRYQPHVIVVLRSVRERMNGGPDYQTREAETRAVVCDLLGLTYEQWPHSDADPDWVLIRSQISDLLGLPRYSTIIAPAWEDGGHEQHNQIATIVDERWPTEAIRYLTYRRGYGRSEDGVRVIPDFKERALKDAALACYASQIAYPPTAPWFGVDQREFVR